jgi:hypothetical protein
MKNILNILLTALLLTSIGFKARAQAVDMALLDPNVNPTNLAFPGVATLNFSIVAEILDEPLSSDDLGISYATVTITLSNLQGSAAILPTGTGADLFTWVYNQVDNAYIGLSKDVNMTADVLYPIVISNLPVVSASTTNNTGFLANLSPPGDLLSSESNDDAVRFYRASPLPVTLVSFTGQKEGQSAVLNWATTQETNSDYFEVQHSTNGKNWIQVGVVKSNGESTSLRNYNFTHQAPINGENLYRLKMVDKDLTFAYSRIKSLQFDGLEKDLSVYPNPVSDKLHIRDFNEVTQIKINDLSGRSVYHDTNAASGEINVKNLVSGTYIVDITRSNGVRTSQKIIISK